MPSITCPSCAATYRVPEAALVPGRRLRCARCGHDWALEAPAGDPAPEAPAEARPPSLLDLERPAAEPERAAAPPAEVVAPPPEPAATPPAEPVAPLPRHDRVPRDIPPLSEPTYPPRPRAGIGLWLAWIATAIALGGAAYALWSWQSGLAEAWPPLQRVVGVPPR